MRQDKKMATGNTVIFTILAILLVITAFYGLDHLVMGMQGLPLNFDLSPAG